MYEKFMSEIEDIKNEPVDDRTENTMPNTGSWIIMQFNQGESNVKGSRVFYLALESMYNVCLYGPNRLM